MKIALPIKSNTLECDISEKFARSNFFAIIDTSTFKFEIVENVENESSSGAGKKVVEFLITKGVEALAAYELGLKVQQIAKGKKLQLILIDYKFKTLNSLITFIKKNIE